MTLTPTAPAVRTTDELREIATIAGPDLELAPAETIHVTADDVHLVGPRGADFRAVNLFARARRRCLRVELA